MFPSWDSEQELIAYRETLWHIGYWIPLIVAFVFGVVGAAWFYYNHLVDNQIDYLGSLSNNQLVNRVETAEVDIAKTVEQIAGLPVVSAELLPGDGESPRRKNGKVANFPGLMVFLGTNIYWSRTSPFVAIRQKKVPILWFQKGASGTLISGQFFDDDGKVICIIDKNRLTRNINNTLTLDTSKKSTLRLIDDKSRLALEINFINPRAIRVIGDFCVQDGTRVIITETEMRIGRFVISGDVMDSGFNVSAGGLAF